MKNPTFEHLTSSELSFQTNEQYSKMKQDQSEK